MTPLKSVIGSEELIPTVSRESYYPNRTVVCFCIRRNWLPPGWSKLQAILPDTASDDSDAAVL